MPELTRDRYLAQLDEVLPFPPERRAEIVEEIEAHREDVLAERIAAGVAPHDAELAAQARLGDPIDLARDLARSEQSAFRLLAAAGAGMRASVGPWIYGYLFAVVALIVAFVAISSIVQLVSNATGWSIPTMNFSGDWNSAITAGSELDATLDLTAVPGVGHWQIALTGVDSDGIRYVVDLSMGGTSTFTGSPFDWIVAVAARD